MGLDRSVGLVGAGELRHLIGGEGVQIDDYQRDSLLGDADDTRDVRLP